METRNSARELAENWCMGPKQPGIVVEPRDLRGRGVRPEKFGRPSRTVGALFAGRLDQIGDQYGDSTQSAPLKWLVREAEANHNKRTFGHLPRISTAARPHRRGSIARVSPSPAWFRARRFTMAGAAANTLPAPSARRAAHFNHAAIAALLAVRARAILDADATDLANA